MRNIALALFVAAFCGPVYAQTYTIDTDKSYIHVITEGGGLFAALSHRHAIALGPLQGTINFEHEGFSLAELTLTPASFEVDNPLVTGLYPSIWDEPVSTEAATGTRKNMLGKKLLNAQMFPAIDLSISRDSNRPDVFTTAVTLKGQGFSFDIPGQLIIDGDQLKARAHFKLNHKQLGLKRFKAAGGAIAVGKTLAFHVNIVAQQTVLALP